MSPTLEKYRRDALRFAKALSLQGCSPGCSPKRHCYRCKATKWLIKEGFQYSEIGGRWVKGIVR